MFLTDAEVVAQNHMLGAADDWIETPAMTIVLSDLLRHPDQIVADVEVDLQRICSGDEDIDLTPALDYNINHFLHTF